jgi:hypothetical protein
MLITARTLLCAVPQPVPVARKGGRIIRRSLHLALALGAVVGLQAVTAGPAAVATLPTALEARPQAILIEPIVTASLDFVPQFGPADLAPQPASTDFTPQLGREPGLFQAILDGAFSLSKARRTKPAQQEAAPEPVGDPDELVPFSGRKIQRWLVHSILKAAHVTGVDPVYMMTLADVESSLSPEAKAPTSSAQGLFQFIDRTWLEIVHLHAADYGFTAAAAAIRNVDGDPVVGDRDREWIMNLRTDPYFSALMAGELIKDVERALQSRGERELAEAELYIAHFLGASAAVRFLEVLDESPDTKASKLFPKAARANKGLFMEGKGRKSRSVSVAELYNKIDSKIVRRMDRYEDISPFLAEITRTAEQKIEASAVLR